MGVALPEPTIQLQFATLLQSARLGVLQPALLATVADVGVEALDRQLAELVPAEDRTLLAAHGLRAELLFAVPCLLEHNPRLLGYYRLLLGYSQKAFYSRRTGVGRLLIMEEKGLLPDACRDQLRAVCGELVRAASWLLHRVDPLTISQPFLHELTLLTLGAQFRGSVNNQIGDKGVRDVFDAIKRVLAGHIKAESGKTLTIRNAAGRDVLITFASDPDIVIQETLDTCDTRNTIAIEIKGGGDSANLHNRMGEAEKSHQKARARGFAECWTILNVDRFDPAKLQQETPSTNRFFRLAAIVGGQGKEFHDFRSRLCSLTGIPDASHPTRRRGRHRKDASPPA